MPLFFQGFLQVIDENMQGHFYRLFCGIVPDLAPADVENVVGRLLHRNTQHKRKKEKEWRHCNIKSLNFGIIYEKLTGDQNKFTQLPSK